MKRTGLRLPDQSADLLVGGAGLEPAEQRPDVGPADAAEDAARDAGERPLAVDDLAAHQHVEHSFGCMLRTLIEVVGPGLVARRLPISAEKASTAATGR